MAAEDYISFDAWDDFYDDRDRSRDPVTVKYTRYLGESPLAFLLEINGSEVWIPKSQIRALSAQEKTVTIPTWLWRAKQMEML